MHEATGVAIAPGQVWSGETALQMDANDPLLQPGQDPYIVSARMALRAWREIRVAWLESLSSSRKPLTWEEAQNARRELARCDAEIARLERLLAEHDAAHNPRGGEQRRDGRSSD